MKSRSGRVPRLFAAIDLTPGRSVELPAAAAHHAVRVLRLGAGDTVTLFNGRGGEHEARIASVLRGRVEAQVISRREVERESPLAAILVQGIASGEKMDLIMQKAVELGVAAIQPVQCARSVARVPADRGAAKLAHWRRVVTAACEQCGRNRIPEVREAVTLDAYCARPGEASLRVVLSPRAGPRFTDCISASARAIVLAAGPESGFDAAEESLLVSAGFVPARLGPRILRAETAALAALAALNALAGDY